MDQTFGIIVSVVGIVGGILLLIGKGSFLMGGGNTDERNRIYDQKKVEKASGITFLAVGLVSVLDLILKNLFSEIFYLVFVVAAFTILIVYMQKKCKK